MPRSRGHPPEYEIRNSISRLYYAFFHASLALLFSLRSDVEHFSKNHGRVHDKVEEIAKPIGRQLRQLADLRRQCDYEVDLLQKKYGGNIEEAREQAMLLLKRTQKYFYWICQEARKELRKQ